MNASASMSLTWMPAGGDKPVAIENSNLTGAERGQVALAQLRDRLSRRSTAGCQPRLAMSASFLAPCLRVNAGVRPWAGDQFEHRPVASLSASRNGEHGWAHRFGIELTRRPRGGSVTA